MSQIKITPALLADIEAKAEFVEPKTYRLNENYDIICDNPHLSGDTILIARVEFGEDAEYIAAANPAVMLAMIERIRQLEAAQCWVIVDENGDTVDGPFFTEEHAKAECRTSWYGRKGVKYRVEPWKGGAE